MTEARPRSATVERLLEYLLDGVAPLDGDDLPVRLGEWLAGSPRFAAFAEAHRDKIRKKLRVAADPGARGDVRAELETAFRLLADRRFVIAFEAYGSGNRGPDFTVTFRAAHKFNLEVTRPRTKTGEADRATAIGHALLGKLRQLPADLPNAIFIATAVAASAEEVASAMRVLRLRADRREEAFFAGRGLTTAEFQRFYRRLAMLLMANAEGPGVHVWSNPEARRRLPEGAAAACVACLAHVEGG